MNQPFLVQPFINQDLGRLVLLVLVALTLVFSIYFLSFATLPRIGPHTRPAGHWLIVAFVLVLVMTAMFVAGAITYHQPDISALTWASLVALFEAVKRASLTHDTLATALLVSLTLALSTAAVVSYLATALRDCTEEQNKAIQSFLLWMHAILTLLVLVYSVLLFKTNVRRPEYANEMFIWYFALVYFMISVLIFLVPAVKCGLLSRQTALWSFAGINVPPWVSGFLSKTGIEAYLPTALVNFGKLI